MRSWDLLPKAQNRRGRGLVKRTYKCSKNKSSKICRNEMQKILSNVNVVHLQMDTIVALTFIQKDGIEVVLTKGTSRFGPQI